MKGSFRAVFVYNDEGSHDDIILKPKSLIEIGLDENNVSAIFTDSYVWSSCDISSSNFFPKAVL